MTNPTKWPVRPAKTQISLGICPIWSESSLSAWRNLGSSATHWAHSHVVGFVVRRLSYNYLFNTRISHTSFLYYYIQYNQYNCTKLHMDNFSKPLELTSFRKCLRIIYLYGICQVHPDHSKRLHLKFYEYQWVWAYVLWQISAITNKFE